MDPLIPSRRQEEGSRSYAPQVVLGVDDIRLSDGVEAGSGSDSDAVQDEKITDKAQPDKDHDDDVADVLFRKSSAGSNSNGLGGHSNPTTETHRVVR